MYKFHSVERRVWDEVGGGEGGWGEVGGGEGGCVYHND